MVRYGILAPSTRTQPWAFSIQGNHVHLIADLSRAHSTADPGRRELYISVGCTLENLLVAAEQFARVEQDGRQTYLQQALAGPHLHLILCGARDVWDRVQAADAIAQHAGLVVIHYLTRSPSDSALVVTGGGVLSRLGIGNAQDTAQYLVRPEGHVGFRCAGRDLGAVTMYLDHWLGSRAPRRNHSAHLQ